MNSWDLSPATILAIIVQVIGFTVFIVRSDNRAAVAKDAAEQAIKDAEGARKHAQEVADKAHRRADEAHLSIGALNANLALFRVQVAENYVDREALREIKRELIDAINKLGDRMDQSINGHK
jgi:NACalpha-BTF3-like transcription factor